mgnify:CR=1 FL=1
MATNAGSTFYHATTHDGVEIIYCDDKDKGIWYLQTSGVGPLQPRGLAMPPNSRHFAFGRITT